MNAPLNAIPVRQNQDDLLKLRRAVSVIYDTAQALVVCQVALAVAVPILSAIATLLFPETKTYAVALAMGLTIADVAYLDRQQKVLLKRAAKISEVFDTTVFEMPWDGFTVGERPRPEDINGADETFQRQKKVRRLRDWYAPVVDQAPIYLARLICQRSSLFYDVELRRSYATAIRVLALGVFVVLAAVGLVEELPTPDLVLFLALSTPLQTWAWRESFRQRDTAEAQETLMQQARKVWDDALADRCGADNCELRAREFQSAIYLRRATAPMFLPGVYKLRRPGLELQMTKTAADFIAEYKGSPAAARHAAEARS
ncbi:S-4TM family putative pore-forming effector [Caulobacter sp. RHG1]|uniref:S-4TM family putative pore-forming effector n=1 Tax=Caulobacter sp. (strain RHG1) TaxID=2545762 RepID=UPI001554D469|nr:S-4TM family putative pore-forming effector [Caulobacter sp. RHG1]NQE65344.1 hypothetical protein [Caulobacter sp. RHG1]